MIFLNVLFCLFIIDLITNIILDLLEFIFLYYMSFMQKISESPDNFTYIFNFKKAFR